MSFTQAERDEMVKLFESSTQCRLSPNALLHDQWFHSSHLIYDVAYAKLIEMIRGEAATVPPPVSPLPAAQ
jgi:hypothetical protein